MTTTDTLIEKMIARRVRNGCREDESRALMDKFLAELGHGVLSACLVHEGFATVKQADAFAAAVAR